ncbi:MAG: HD domain-containing protein [Betaproteobacteria bacterium]|nr:HD domain-containing protein [Betaproteobacteria bacterium]
MPAAAALKNQSHFDDLIRVSRELSSGKPLPALFQGVIDIVCESTGAEGGTLYMYDNKQNTLKAVLLTNRPLKMNSVVEEFDPLSVTGFIEVPLAGDGRTQSAKVSASAFLRRRIIAVEDVNNNAEFDFAGVRAFDAQNNYKTESIIALPLASNNISVGVLQVINPRRECFSAEYVEFLEALAGQIAIALNNAVLIKEGENLLGAIVQMISMAIDEKSPHTAGHCYRVTELTMLLADAVAEEKSGKYAGFTMTETEREELRMAALLHDVGKVITPTHILEKRTKLYSLSDRIDILNERVYMWKISAELDALKKALKKAGREDLIESAAAEDPLREDITFLDKVNKSEVVMTPENMQKLENISSRTILRPSEEAGPKKIITRGDLSNLQTFRGTLNPEERKIMEDHVRSTIRLLSSIPWPNKFSRLVEYAGHHHEKMDGTGYPNKIGAEEMSVPARILGIADRFEGMSAPDRPYRSKKMSLSQVIKIMTYMSKDGEIDPDLFKVFLDSKIHVDYGRRYLEDALVDCD